jgi:hypothetical protein
MDCGQHGEAAGAYSCCSYRGRSACRSNSPATSGYIGNGNPVEEWILVRSQSTNWQTSMNSHTNTMTAAIMTSFGLLVFPIRTLEALKTNEGVGIFVPS